MTLLPGRCRVIDICMKVLTCRKEGASHHHELVDSWTIHKVYCLSRRMRVIDGGYADGRREECNQINTNHTMNSNEHQHQGVIMAQGGIGSFKE
jgi:hypothetical protein